MLARLWRTPPSPEAPNGRTHIVGALALYHLPANWACKCAGTIEQQTRSCCSPYQTNVWYVDGTQTSGLFVWFFAGNCSSSPVNQDCSGLSPEVKQAGYDARIFYRGRAALTIILSRALTDAEVYGLASPSGLKLFSPYFQPYFDTLFVSFECVPSTYSHWSRAGVLSRLNTYIIEPWALDFSLATINQWPTTNSTGSIAVRRTGVVYDDIVEYYGWQPINPAQQCDNETTRDPPNSVETSQGTTEVSLYTQGISGW